MLYDRKRNRENAKRSRQRKKVLTTTLQQSILQLKVENKKLRNHLSLKLGKSQTNELLHKKLGKCPAMSREAQFAGYIKHLSSRPLDVGTQEFLERLRRSVSHTALHQGSHLPGTGR